MVDGELKYLIPTVEQIKSKQFSHMTVLVISKTSCLKITIEECIFKIHNIPTFVLNNTFMQNDI